MAETNGVQGPAGTGVPGEVQRRALASRRYLCLEVI